MSQSKVTVIDYGVGNLFSVRQALERCGAEVKLSSSPEEIRASDRVVLPGVGAFSDGMEGLRSRGLVEATIGFARSGKPFLGICLGMQMMLSVSEEFGEHEGLGLIPGRVRRVPATGTNGLLHKIPHIGWNALVPPTDPGSWKGTILEGCRLGDSAYFVHSYGAVPASPAHLLANTFYDGQAITAVIRAGNMYGCQFHPEKSAEVGLKILRSFLSL